MKFFLILLTLLVWVLIDTVFAVLLFRSGEYAFMFISGVSSLVLVIAMAAAIVYRNDSGSGQGE